MDPSTHIGHRIAFAPHRHRMISQTQAHRIASHRLPSQCNDISTSHRIASTAHRSNIAGHSEIASNRIASHDQHIDIASPASFLSTSHRSVMVASTSHRHRIISAHIAGITHRHSIASFDIACAVCGKSTSHRIACYSHMTSNRHRIAHVSTSHRYRIALDKAGPCNHYLVGIALSCGNT